MAVKSFRIRNLLSIRDATLELSTPVTLMIGPNGAGKSNFLYGIELLSRLTDGTFQETMMRRGGFRTHLFQGKPPTEFTSNDDWNGYKPDRFAIVVFAEGKNKNQESYEVQFMRGDGDSPLVRERAGFYYVDEKGTECASFNGWHPASEQSLWSRTVTMDDKTGESKPNVSPPFGCRAFHFDDTSARSPVLQSCDVADSQQLHSDGRNLAAVLLRMQQTDQERYQAILRSVRVVAPFFGDFVVTPEYEGSRYTILRWKQRGIDGILSGERLSSGTLRFICLVVLLQQTNPPQMIALDEPELGLHPFAIYQLADMLHECAGTERKIIVTTQSVTLANQFPLQEIALVTRENGGTVITRPNEKDYEVWLEDYTVGQMWESNILDVAPRSEVGAS